MNCNNTTCKILISNNFKSSFLNHARKLSLFWKLPYTLYKILIRVSITCKQLPKHRYDIEAVIVVNLLENRYLNFWKFQTHKSTPSPKNPVSFTESLLSVSDVSDSKSNGVQIVRVWFKLGQVFCIYNGEVKIIQTASLCCSFLADVKHVWVYVRYCYSCG